ncbi:MAG TPA: hypothetical protein VG929_07070 [Actinomycetota bacterium]|nr:hypothetical protein [Actinomycetota bacterium]
MRTTDATFLALVDEYVGEHRMDPVVDDAVDPWLYSADCGVTKVLAGGKQIKPISRLYVGGLKIFEGRVKDEMAGRMLSTWRDVITAHSNEFVRVRAAAVEVNGTAIVMPSAPQPHLPMLAGLLTREGAGYLGDELVNIDAVFRRVHGLSLPLLVDGSDLGAFPDIVREPTKRRPKGTPEEVEGRTPRRPVPIRSLGRAAAGPVPIGWIVFPTFVRGDETGFREMARAEAVFRLSQAILNLHIWNERALFLMQDLVDDVAVAELRIGSPEEAVRLILDAAPSLVPAAGR